MPVFMAVILLVGLLGLVGQAIVAFRPALGERTGMLEREENTDRVFYDFERGVAVADLFVIWSVPLAAMLYFLDDSAWPYFGIMGGTIFSYYAVLAPATRLLQRAGTAIGGDAYVRTVYVNSVVWLLTGPALIIVSILELEQ